VSGASGGHGVKYEQLGGREKPDLGPSETLKCLGSGEGGYDRSFSNVHGDWNEGGRGAL